MKKILPNIALRNFAAVGLLSLALTMSALAGSGSWTLIGWNNLGMHCMDDDYSVFSILPPFNTLDVQLIDAGGKLVTSSTGVTVTYQGVEDPDGSINTTSLNKSNFWQYALPLFGASLATDAGLAGNKMPGATNTPQLLIWSASETWFEGAGIPLIPTDDNGNHNTYPMMRLVAQDNTGNVLAQTDVVLPVSDEMDCRACHASGSGPAAMPDAGWVNDSSSKRDFRLNILQLHDDRFLASQVYQDALAAKGYLAAGLFATVQQKATPILCASCHSSEALGTAGAAGVPSLTQSMHSLHARVISPANGLKLDASNNRSSCYQCHPGSSTRCLRGAMGAAVAADGSMEMQCQSCHGSMSQVGAATRTGWLDEPACQNCHTGSATQNSGQIRFTSAFANGQLRQPANQLFATNQDTPLAGKSLYRFSKGHGGLMCEACHGSTHAEFPSAHRNDNILSQELQGHTGVLVECTACHATMPSTVSGGPHGMHPVGPAWVGRHGESGGGRAACQACHGMDYKGTVLSRMQADRTFKTGDFGTKTFWKGSTVGCYDCHNGPGGESATPFKAPTVSNAKLVVGIGQSGSVLLPVKGAVNPLLRIVRQPMHGTVALNGATAQYFPDAGYAGPDFFQFAASDSAGYRDSATTAYASVTVGSPATLGMLDTDHDGIPDLTEYALGLLPNFPSVNDTNKPTLELFKGKYYLTLTLSRYFPPADAQPVIEVSANMKTWKPAVIITNDPGTLKARDSVAYKANQTRYIRVRVVRP